MIVAAGNDYLVGVKGNQPKLLAHLQTHANTTQPDSTFAEQDTSHGRRVHRQVDVFQHLPTLAPQWCQPRSGIRVRRYGWREGKAFEEEHFYLSSLALSAQDFAQGIRGHWSIENSLHWVKDVVLREDAAPYRQHNCATNWSVLRNMALNLCRSHGFASLTQAIRAWAHDLTSLLALFSE